MSNPLMPVVAQLPAVDLLNGEPILILGFDTTDALCIRRDGSLDYVSHMRIRVDWQFDENAGVWTSSVSTMEDVTLVEPEPEPEPEPGVSPAI